MIEEEPLPNEDTQQPGQLLRSTREKKQLSIEQVAGALHLSVDIISQLEQNQFDKIAAPTYTRGYLRSYAKFLGLDGETVVGHFNQNLENESTPEIIPEVSQKSQVTSGDRPVKITTYLISFALIVMLLLWWQSKYLLNDSVVNQAPAGIPDNQSQTGVAPAFSYDFNVIEHTAEVFLPPDSNPVVYEEEAQLTDVHDMDVPVDSLDSNSEVIGDNIVINTGGDGSTGNLTLIIEEESWVEVYNAMDKRLFHRLAQPGSAIKITGLVPLSVLLGNASGVKVEFNDQSVDTEPFTRANVARLRLGE